ESTQVSDGIDQPNAAGSGGPVARVRPHGRLRATDGQTHGYEQCRCESSEREQGDRVPDRLARVQAGKEMVGPEDERDRLAEPDEVRNQIGRTFELQAHRDDVE